MADDASGERASLDDEIERTERAIGMLREYTARRHAGDGAWAALERAEDKLGDLLNRRSQENQLGKDHEA